MSETKDGGTAAPDARPPIEMVYAVARNGVIGRDGGMPWRLPSDLAGFKARTMGAAVVMGRRTHESIGRPLPGRLNIVLTRRGDYDAPGCLVVDGVEAALEAVADHVARAGWPDRIAVIGGAAIYRAFEPMADRLAVTYVDAAPEGDTRVPPVDPTRWREVSREVRERDPRDSAPTQFVVYERRGR